METKLADTERNTAEGVSLSALVPWAFEIAEELNQEAIVRAAKGHEHVSCRQGCGACCRNLVRISIPEALYLFECFEGLDQAKQEDYADRIRESVSILERNGLGNSNEELSAGWREIDYDFRTHELARRYHSLGLACPFLENEACSIYPIRPLVCRQYLVTTPPSLCADPFTLNVRRVPISARLGGILAEIAAELLHVPIEVIALPMAMDWVNLHPHILDMRWNPEELRTVLLAKFKT